MRIADALALALGALRAHRLRTVLSVLSIAIGITAVVLLTSIGEGTRRFVIGEFTQFGTNIFSVTPGKIETAGLPGVFGGTTRKLTLDDAQAMYRVPGVQTVIPVVMGQSRVESGGLGRSVYVFGVTSDAPLLWKFGIRRGRFLPAGDPRRGGHEAVLGPGLARELFGTEAVVGRFVRAAGARLRVVGVTTPKGRVLGFDMDDLAYIPVATAMRLFNLDELTEIDVTFEGRQGEAIVEDVRALLTARHAGHEDFTIMTQAQMLDVMDDVLGVVTLAVAGIGAVSLLVGAVGILTMMWISVGERTGEIGLMRALGARAAEVRRVFLIEAVGLAATGGVLGLLLGAGIAAGLRVVLPGLPVHTRPEYVVLALLVSTATGLASGVAPAGRAARLDPVQALRAE